MLAIVITTSSGFVFGAVASRSFGIYFLMLTLTFGVIANFFFGSGDEARRLLADRRHQPAARRASSATSSNDRERLYYIALGCALVVYVLIRYLVRTPFGLSLQGIRDEPVRAASLGYTVPLHRMLAFGFAAFIASLAGVLASWWDGQIAPGRSGSARRSSLLVMAVIGGLGADRGRVARRVRVHRDQQRGDEPDPGDGLPVVGGRFNTVIGLDLPRDRHRLARRADGHLGPALERRARRGGAARRRGRAHRAGDGTVLS